MTNGWRTVQVPEGIISEIEKYLKTPDAKKKGLTSISAVVTACLRKELDDIG